MVKDYVVFDLETTGLSPDKDTIIEIGCPEGSFRGKWQTVFRSLLILIRS